MWQSSSQIVLQQVIEVDTQRSRVVHVIDGVTLAPRIVALSQSDEHQGGGAEASQLAGGLREGVGETQDGAGADTGKGGFWDAYRNGVSIPGLNESCTSALIRYACQRDCSVEGNRDNDYPKAQCGLLFVVCRRDFQEHKVF